MIPPSDRHLRRHVCPPSQHDTNGLDCACGPEYFRLCDKDHPDADPRWKCSPRGMIAVEPFQS